MKEKGLSPNPQTRWVGTCYKDSDDKGERNPAVHLDKGRGRWGEEGAEGSWGREGGGEVGGRDGGSNPQPRAGFSFGKR